MLLDLSQLRTGNEHIERQAEPESLGIKDDGFRVLSPIVFVADIRKDSQKVRLVGSLKTMVECDCSRCLDPFPVPVDVSFDLVFLPVSDNAGHDESEVADDDLGVSFYKESVIDLGEVIREQLYLALPMKPLCREDCRGLCPVCGINRNRDTCTCQATWEDPRMAALKNLRRQ